MIRALVLACLVLAGAGCEAARPQQQAANGTPATEQLQSWLDVFNAADVERWRQFLVQFVTPRPEPYVDQNVGLRNQTGGFEVVRIESASDTRAVATVRERDGEGIGATISIEVEPDAPHRIVDVSLQPGLRLPVEIPRLSERELMQSLDAELTTRAADDRFSGAVLVARGATPVHQSAWGLADRQRRIPNQVNTRFRNGSMSKMFTAVAVMSLVEAGKVRLDAPVGTYLTDYPNPDVARRVTVHQLLTHTGGTGDVFGPGFASQRDRLREHRDYVAAFAAQPLLFDPGARWMYSNYGFVLLGALIERVSGVSYYDYVRTHVYAPAGMTDTGAEPENVSVERRAIGYMRPPGTPAFVPNDPTLPYRGTAAGGGYTTVGDLARFATALTGYRLLSAESTATLLRGTVDGAGGRYGYGFVEHESNGVRSVGHGGNAPGMDGDLQIFPDSGYVVAVLANVDPPAAQRVSQFVANRLPAK